MKRKPEPDELPLDPLVGYAPLCAEYLIPLMGNCLKEYFLNQRKKFVVNGKTKGSISLPLGTPLPGKLQPYFFMDKERMWGKGEDGLDAFLAFLQVK